MIILFCVSCDGLSFLLLKCVFFFSSRRGPTGSLCDLSSGGWLSDLGGVEGSMLTSPVGEMEAVLAVVGEMGGGRGGEGG